MIYPITYQMYSKKLSPGEKRVSICISREYRIIKNDSLNNPGTAVPLCNILSGPCYLEVDIPNVIKIPICVIKSGSRNCCSVLFTLLIEEKYLVHLDKLKELLVKPGEYGCFGWSLYMVSNKPTYYTRNTSHRTRLALFDCCNDYIEYSARMPDGDYVFSGYGEKIEFTIKDDYILFPELLPIPIDVTTIINKQLFIQNLLAHNPAIIEVSKKNG
jgi:hypothetical protein